MEELNAAGKLCLLPDLSDTLTAALERERCMKKLKTLKTEFIRRFADFETQKFRFELFTNPFGVDVDSVPEHLQLELIELQSSGPLKAKLDSVGAVSLLHSSQTLPQHVREHLFV